MADMSHSTPYTWENVGVKKCVRVVAKNTGRTGVLARVLQRNRTNSVWVVCVCAHQIYYRRFSLFLLDFQRLKMFMICCVQGGVTGMPVEVCLTLNLKLAELGKPGAYLQGQSQRVETLRNC